MCFGVFRQPSAPCVSVGTAVCALSLKICIRLSVRVRMCVCVCASAIANAGTINCVRVCVHASVSAHVKSATLSICLNRGLLSQFSSLWTMLVLEGDRLHKLSLSPAHTHTHTLLTQCFYSHAESDAAVWRRATSQRRHNEAKRQRRGTNQPHQHVHITDRRHQQPAVTVIITTVFINIVSDAVAGARCSEP